MDQILHFLSSFLQVLLLHCLRHHVLFWRFGKQCVVFVAKELSFSLLFIILIVVIKIIIICFSRRKWKVIPKSVIIAFLICFVVWSVETSFLDYWYASFIIFLLFLINWALFAFLVSAITTIIWICQIDFFDIVWILGQESLWHIKSWSCINFNFFLNSPIFPLVLLIKSLNICWNCWLLDLLSFAYLPSWLDHIVCTITSFHFSAHFLFTKLLLHGLRIHRNIMSCLTNIVSWLARWRFKPQLFIKSWQFFLTPNLIK